MSEKEGAINFHSLLLGLGIGQTRPDFESLEPDI